MEQTDKTDDVLDALFSEAKETDFPDHLFATMVTDMTSHVPEVQATPVQSKKWGFAGLFGAWPAWSSMATALAVGIVIGYNPPDAIWTATDAIFAADIMGLDLGADEFSDLWEDTL